MREKLIEIFKYAFLSVAAFLSIFPFIWMLIGATNTSTDITKGKLSFGSELMNNINKLLEVVDVPTVFFNSL